MTSSWKERATAKLRSRNSLIPVEFTGTSSTSSLPAFSWNDNVDPTETIKNAPHLLTPLEIEITNAPLQFLQSSLSTGKWTAVDVCSAYMKRSLIAHQLTNCLTEVFFDRALTKARSLDDHFKSTGGKVVGPLHGIPISLKDCINVQGVETTLGFVSKIGEKPSANAVIVDLLEQSGAVLFAKTNLPQTMMWIETDNAIFGRTVNAYNRSLTSGGSSGGEGSLLAMKGSPLGLGTDVGGSIRIPASFNGLYGLRPSFHRLPFAGISSTSTTLAGQEGVYTVVGPLCPTIFGIKLLVQTLLSQHPWNKDPMCIRKPWDEEAYRNKGSRNNTRLCFAVMWDDGVVRPHPPVRRALEEVKTALERAGHQVIDWKPIGHLKICNTLRKLWSIAPPDLAFAPLNESGEPRMRLVERMFTGIVENVSPIHRQSPSASVTKAATSAEKQAGRTSKTQQQSPLATLWNLNNERRAHQAQYLQHWEATISQTGTGRPVDAIIAPIAPYGPPPHGTNFYVDYTAVWNTLDYPALSIPVTRVDPTVDAPKGTPPSTPFYNTMDKMNWERYDPMAYKNGPVGIQLVTRTLEAEALIGMGEVIVDALQSSSPRVVAGNQNIKGAKL